MLRGELVKVDEVLSDIGYAADALREAAENMCEQCRQRQIEACDECEKRANERFADKH